jgi:L-threonylcarbamoyladenylate synthase
MRTEIVWAQSMGAYERALDHLRRGDVIAIPTDTVYGVTADGFNPEAIDKLFTVKDRPHDKPIPLLLSDASDLDQIALDISGEVNLLAKRFWPGALTLIVRSREKVPAILRAGSDSVAVRVPDHAVPRDLSRALGRPLAATSANISGGPNPSTAEEVRAQLGERLEYILDGGRVGSGMSSTVVDVTVAPPRVLRAGALPLAEIEAVLGLKLGADVDRN